jgi:hypothetical protein
MTICIAAICDHGTDSKILFCADRLISAGIQFESGSSKIIKITDYCYTLHASDDSLFSERVLNKAKERIAIANPPLTIKQIVDIFCEECITLKRSKQEKDIISKYNFVVGNVKADPNQIVADIMDDIDYYQYPTFEFIIAGMDSPTEPHIYKVIQEGDWACWDSLGFVTTGAGQNLAFTEMTKWYYSTAQSMTFAIPRIYFAKKVSERVQGVGRSTDLSFMCYREDAQTNEMKAKVYDISADLGFMEKLDKSFDKLVANESDIITQLANEIQKEIEEAHTEKEERFATS